MAFLTQATYAYRFRILSELKYVSWCIGAVRKSDITHWSLNNLVMQFIVADLTVVIVLALVMPLHSLQVAPVRHSDMPGAYTG